MFEKICELLKKYTSADVQITPDTSIYDLGINSLDLASLIGDIEDELDREIQMDKFTDIETVGQIVDAINEAEADE